MAISATTLTDMVLDAGSLYIASVDIGATVGGSQFTVQQEIYWPDLDGARGNVVGTGKVINEVARLVANAAEITIAKIAAILPTVVSASGGGSEYTSINTFGYVGSSQHKSVEWKGQTMDLDNIIITLFNAMNNGGNLEMAFTDTGETVYPITFEGFYGSTTPTTRTWQIAIQS